MEEFIDDLEKEKDHLEKIIKVVGTDWINAKSHCRNSGSKKITT